MVWETDDRLRMSNKGFKFLLKDVHTQIWALLLKYIDSADTRKVEDGKGDGAGAPKYVVRKELLSFLLRTSFLTFGQVLTSLLSLLAIRISFLLKLTWFRDTQSRN